MTSAYRRLFVWVEGPDDERFFRSVVSSRFGGRYDEIAFQRYAGLTPDKVSNFLRSIRAMQADYIFVADIDKLPCVTGKKAVLTAH